MTRRLTNHWVSLHQDGVPAGFKPLLVMDVWEHAFMRDYRATERGRYLDAFLRNVDWPIAEHRLVEPMAVRPSAAPGAAPPRSSDRAAASPTAAASTARSATAT